MPRQKQRERQGVKRRKRKLAPRKRLNRSTCMPKARVKRRKRKLAPRKGKGKKTA